MVLCRSRIPAEVYAYCDFIGHYDAAVFIGSFTARLKPRSLDPWCVRHFPQRYLLAAHYFGLWRIGCCGSLTLDVLFARVPKKRVLTLFDPESDALGAGWNIIQSKIAIGSGGLMGKGFTEGTQSHLGYLPEHHTDFIMSTYAEEFGFIGVFLLFSLFAAIIIRCLIIGMNSFHNFGRLYAGAVGLTFFFFVLLNSGMVSGILPVTGDPLPLMSYGGTAVITMLASMGIVMSIHTHR